ncbi:MAG: hypothetical protein Q7L55_05825 [Actinomycetota bacterium]|nr:hypothetical protein [Actinomycetota bacterium]
MILVIIWSTVLLAMSAVVAQTVVNQIRPSERSEISYQAWAAAEAGIDDYRARLAANSNYYTTVDSTNLAFTSWVNVPGGTSPAQFIYSVDTSQASRSGRIRVTASGRAGTGSEIIVRTVEAEINKRTSADYSYLSNYETWPVDYPDAYDGKSGSLTAAEAAVMCVNRIWASSGPVLVTTTGSTVSVTQTGLHRNSLKCKHDAITRTESWYGDMHTNDVWYFDSDIANIDPATDPGVSGQVFHGLLTSSCPLPTTTTAGCPANHRWIDETYLGSNSNQSYLAAEIIDTTQPKLWNPTYESSLEMPTTVQVSTMKSLAQSAGCLFTGTTRIRFYTTNGAGKIAVTSPDTKSTNAFCQVGTALEGTTHAAIPTTAQHHPTAILDYATMVAAGFNGVIYVQDVPTTSTDPNYWSVTPPTCEIKIGTNPYPFVIPDPTLTYNDNALFSGSGTNHGFPIETTNASGQQIDTWSTPTSSMCRRGTVYAQGTYTGQYTMVADGDIAITGRLLDATVTNTTYTSPTAADYGVPAATSTNLMGLVPRAYLYIFHPSVTSGNNQWISANMQNLIVDAAVLSREGCFAIQDYTSSPTMGNLTIVGSIGQDFRCKLTNTSSNAGYQDLNVHYDPRFKTLSPPPFMQVLSSEPWHVLSMSETSIRRDAEARTGVAAVTGTQAQNTEVLYDVLAGAPSGSVLNFARITGGYGTITVVNGRVQFTSPNGIATTTAEFVITKPDGAHIAQTLTISTT